MVWAAVFSMRKYIHYHEINSKYQFVCVHNQQVWTWYIFQDPFGVWGIPSSTIQHKLYEDL